MRYKTDKGSHSVYSLQFHYVACVKYRTKVFSDHVSARLKDINLSVAEKFGIEIIAQETDKDHIHILFASRPSVQVSAFVNSLKSVSARLLFREFPDIKKALWGGKFWSRSYFLATTGQVSLETIRKYVENQGA